MSRAGHPSDRKAAADLMRTGRARHPKSISRAEWNRFVRETALDNLRLITDARKSLGAGAPA